MSSNPKEGPPAGKGVLSRIPRSWLLLALVAVALSQLFLLRGNAPATVPYSEFLSSLDEGKIEKVELRANEIIATLKERVDSRPISFRTVRLPGIDETDLVARLGRHGVRFGGKVEQVAWWQSALFGWGFPLLLIGAFYYFSIKRMGKGGPLSFGKTKAKIYDSSAEERVTFEDVAGVDEAEGELIEVVDFLKTPDKYRSLGAHIPKGVLLVGPPGTGKTLLARAIAGEAGVPFFSISGSDFVEMFVGVGAARVRDLFEQAKTRAPCIIFIDEIDAIGRSRGGLGVMAANDEREQTLNQLLAEMDGFDARTGVVIMAATNRPEILDPALLRAGRFDRQVLVDRPDVGGREDILKVHVRKVSLATRVDLHLVAQRTPGMVGADLANVVNEAALAAVRRAAKEVEQQDFEEAIDRIQLGLRKRGRVMTEEDKRRVAYHEAGHALVAMSVEHSDPVHRVTIIPRSIGALGATLQLPTEERYLMTREELLDRICVMMGGRAAEELVFSDVSTGAQNDLERASELARQMVCRFGMSELGAQTFGRPMGLRFLETPFSSGEERNYSEETARMIDAEVRRLLESELERARTALARRKRALIGIAERLLIIETIDREELERLVGAAWPERAVSATGDAAVSSAPLSAADAAREPLEGGLEHRLRRPE